MKNEYSIIGVMSGTSLDGLDLAYCSFLRNFGNWYYKVMDAVTIPYSLDFKTILSSLVNSSALELVKMDAELGVFIADAILDFIKEQPQKPDIISSHGHTVFHQPDKNITSQIGNGAVIAAKTGITVVSDFRTADVALGGQGAPLVPIGDQLLFGEYDACLNLGGFSNISFCLEGKRVAFDIAPCNMPLNRLAVELGIDYDKNGQIAESGMLNIALLDDLNALDYYSLKGAKSLSYEWFDHDFWPLIEKYDIEAKDKLRTVTEHIACQLTNVFNRISGNDILITGGGAKNKFLVKRLTEMSGKNVIIPDEQTIDFKEAIVFAFLGLLRVREEINCLKEVTGASANSCCGAVYLPPPGMNKK
jgi:anhydro-N-acetylmuramic acid kinase